MYIYITQICAYHCHSIGQYEKESLSSFCSERDKREERQELTDEMTQMVHVTFRK